MVRWIDKKKDGILDTKLSPSSQYSEAEEDDEVMEVAPPNEVPEQASLADAGEEEETAYNPPLAKDEPALITLDEATPIPLDEDGPTNV